jgi:hypothetical protein
MTPSQANQALSLIYWNLTDLAFRAALSEGEVKAFIDSNATYDSAAAIERTLALAGVEIPRRTSARVKLANGRPTFDFHPQKRGSGPVVILRAGKRAATEYSVEDAVVAAENEEVNGDVLVARALRWCVAKCRRQ